MTAIIANVNAPCAKKRRLHDINSGMLLREEWILDGLLHRLFGPAEIQYTSIGDARTETYCIEGKRHREDGPARIQYGEGGKVILEEYWVNGQMHRLHGPARIRYTEFGNVLDEYARVDYFIEGRNIPARQYTKLMKYYEEDK